MSLKTIPFFGKSWTSRMVRRRRSEMDSMAADSTSGEELEGIARTGPVAHLEVEMGTAGAPGLADLRHRGAGVHAVAVLHQHLAVVGVQRDEPARVPHDDDEPVAGLRPDVDHLAGRGGPHRRALRRRQVDAVVPLSLLHAEAAVEHALHRPLQRTRAALAREERLLVARGPGGSGGPGG